MSTGVLPLPPIGSKDPEVWRRFLLSLDTASKAPSSARFLVATTDTALTDEVNLGAMATGYVLATVTLGQAAISTVETIPVATGGTGATALTNHGVVLGQGTSAVAVTGPGTAGQVLTSNGSAADPSFQSLSGTYTPTLTNVANLSASAAFTCQWLRLGNVVTVSGRVNVDPVATSTLTQLGISLPVATNFTASEQCGGTGATNTVAQFASVMADAANDRALLEFIAATTSLEAMWFSFTYLVA